MLVDLRLPVERLPVVLLLADGSQREGTLFLGPPGQPPEQVLESTEWFVPVLEAGTVHLYARAALAALIVPEPPRIPDEEDFLPRYPRPVRVKLRSGVSLSGNLRYAEPVERTRTADYLNQRARSFALHGDRAVYHVAKAHVEQVEEM
jgi:hypothetical protein